MLLAMDLEALLQKHGVQILDSAPSIPRALVTLDNCQPDTVTLDMNFDGESSTPLAKALNERRVPFIVISGYSKWDFNDPAFEGAPLVKKKPCNNDDLLQKLTGLFA